MSKSTTPDAPTIASKHEPRIEGIRFVIDRAAAPNELSDNEVRTIGLSLFLQESTHTESLWGSTGRVESLGRNE